MSMRSTIYFYVYLFHNSPKGIFLGVLLDSTRSFPSSSLLVCCDLTSRAIAFFLSLASSSKLIQRFEGIPLLL